MIDRLGTRGEAAETLQCSSSVNKQREALLEAAKGMQHWLWQLSPQGGGLSHKLIEHSHLIRQFHLEPSRYIKPHWNEEFTEVPLHSPRSPQITCLIVRPCPLLVQRCTSLLDTPEQCFAHAAGWVILVIPILLDTEMVPVVHVEGRSMSSMSPEEWGQRRHVWGSIREDTPGRPSGSLLPGDTPLNWEPVADWTLQLIGLI